MTDHKFSKDIQQFFTKPATVEFLRSARHFVSLLQQDDIDRSEFLHRAHSALAELYAAGHNLEIIPLKYSSHTSNFDRERLMINKDVGLISQFEGIFYWQVFDPTYSEHDGQPGLGWKREDKEASPGWLVDDFWSIYKDLEFELYKIDTISTDESAEDALWQMKFGFSHHWGNHCINALRYFHYWYYEGRKNW